VLVTRFELFLRSRGIAPAVLSKKTNSRQHLLRLRLGESLAPRRCILAITAACEALTGEAVAPEVLFESADALLACGRRRLRELHASDLDLLERAVAAGEIADTVQWSGIASETAAAYLLRAARQRIAGEAAAAEEIFAAARTMASALTATPRALAAALSAEALHGRAEARRELGRIDEALEDLAMAAALFATARYCDSEAAEVEYARAGALFRHGRHDEGIAAAQQARGHFLSARDARGAAHAEIAEARMRFDQDDTDGARAIFHRLRATLWKLRDRDALSRVWLGLALCDIRRGDRASARHWLHRAGVLPPSTGSGESAPW
jgi:tetratricopeptide (TPR) repeat protein